MRARSIPARETSVPMNQMPARAGVVLAAAVVPVLAAPSLLPPSAWPAVALLAGAVIVRMTWLLRPSAGWGLGLLSVAVAIACVRTPLQETLPHLAGYALGLLGAWCVVTLGLPRALRWHALVGTCAVLLGVCFLRVDTFKFLPMALTDALPQLGRFMPWIGGEGRINPNALSALCLIEAPLLWAAAGVHGLGWRLSARTGLVLSGLAVILAQSRSAWLSFAVVALGAWCMHAWWMPPARRPLAAAVAVTIAAAAFCWWWDPAEVARIVVSGWSTFDRRLHTWDAALAMVGDHFWMGMGLDRFRHVYEPSAGAPPGFDIAHAHNLALQMLLDVGTLGLVGYGWTTVTSVKAAWRLAMSAPALGRRVGVAMLWSTALFHMFGLFDAVALGTKIGIFHWQALALVWVRLDAGTGLQQEVAGEAPQR
jgi:hypothetical protein